MDNNTTSSIGKVATIPTSESAFKFFVWGTLSIVHSPSFAK